MSITSKRLLSLDILRGLTVAGMILVNNGAGREHFYPLTHSAWNGLTPCDLVFPFFLFMVGMSVPMSSKSSMGRILWRSVKMFAIGVLLHAWDMWIGGKEDILGHLRLWGVLERIALCYLAVATLHHYCKSLPSWQRLIPVLSLGLLVVYSGILLLGNGYAQDETNIACIVDRWLVGENHLYHKSPIDPEGLLGTISAIAHALIGLYIGLVIKEKTLLQERLIRLFCIASALILGGWLLSFGLPFNKRIWSPSYVLVTCGFATALLSLLICYEKRQEQYGLSTFHFPFSVFHSFGLNPIALYVLSEMLAPVSGYLNLGGMMHESLTAIDFSPQLASLCYALSFVAVMTLIAMALHRRKIYIKL